MERRNIRKMTQQGLGAVSPADGTDSGELKRPSAPGTPVSGPAFAPTIPAGPAITEPVTTVVPRDKKISGPPTPREEPDDGAPSQKAPSGSSSLSGSSPPSQRKRTPPPVQSSPPSQRKRTPAPGGTGGARGFRDEEIGTSAALAEIAAGISRRAIPRLVRSRDELAAAPINHREGFLLAHVDGSTTVQGLIDVSGMTEDEVMAIVGRLRRLGIVQLG
ncbi:hypothetical protein [Labilithrix luteola]|nr:hypothetical protein [Labilithrix luteola]